MKANKEMFTAEELEQLRGGFSDSFVISEEEETNEGNGGFLSNCDCTTDKDVAKKDAKTVAAN